MLLVEFERISGTLTLKHSQVKTRKSFSVFPILIHMPSASSSLQSGVITVLSWHWLGYG